MEEELKKKTEESIKKILKEGITTNNLEHLYKLSKINKIAKEEEDMYGEYGEYGARGRGRGSYGEYGNYGEYNEGYREGYGARRGRRRRYRGDDHLERMQEEYGRYNEGRERYGANDEDSQKSFYYMVEALKDFIKVIEQEADSQQQKQMLKNALQQSMM